MLFYLCVIVHFRQKGNIIVMCYLLLDPNQDVATVYQRNTNLSGASITLFTVSHRHNVQRLV